MNKKYTIKDGRKVLKCREIMLKIKNMVFNSTTIWLMAKLSLLFNWPSYWYSHGTEWFLH